jgi:hypothetical protein
VLLSCDLIEIVNNKRTLPFLSPYLNGFDESKINLYLKENLPGMILYWKVDMPQLPDQVPIYTIRHMYCTTSIIILK